MMKSILILCLATKKRINREPTQYYNHRILLKNYFEHHTYLLDTNTEAMVQEFPEEIQHLLFFIHWKDCNTNHTMLLWFAKTKLELDSRKFYL